MTTKRRALLSVYRKEGIAELARGLAARGFEIVSSGGTADELAKAGVKALGVSTVTLDRMARDGRLPCVWIGRRRRVRPADLERVVAKGTSRAGAR